MDLTDIDTRISYIGNKLDTVLDEVERLRRQEIYLGIALNVLNIFILLLILTDIFLDNRKYI